MISSTKLATNASAIKAELSPVGGKTVIVLYCNAFICRACVFFDAQIHSLTPAIGCYF